MLKTNGETVYKLGKTGVVKQIHHKVQLRLDRDHYYTQDVFEEESGNWVRKKVIKAKGFDFLAQLVGFSTVRPEYVRDEDGLETSNPIVRYGTDGTIEFVRIREIGMGRAESGNMRTVDLTLTYNVQAALAAKLFDTYKEQNYPTWGKVLNSKKAAEACEEKGSRAMVPVGPGVCLVYDLCSPIVLQILSDLADDAPTLDRTAGTIVRRNVMRVLFGFDYAEDDGTVDVVAWPHDDLDFTKLELNRKLLVDGEHIVLDEEEAEL